MISSDIANLQEQAGQAAADLRQERTRRLGPDAVTWLALPPQWTARLAGACGFPAPKTLLPWIEDAVAAGLCQRQALLDGLDDDLDLDSDEGPDVRFWMPETERGEVLGDFRGRTTLRRLAADIGERIKAAPSSIERDPGLDRWADLAVRGLRGSRTGEWLTTMVSGCVSSGRMAEALDWVYAAEALAPVLGEEVASAAARAKRLINLEYRRRTDMRFIEHFLPRPGQREEIERLLSSRPGEPWAVHFVGMGGVGKTMFIRYLSGAFTALGGPDVLTTRVDFDHISPRYPVEQPGQLLRELAGGLTGHLVEADQVSAYGHFVECADVLDRVTVMTPGRGGVGSAEFEYTLDAFADLLRAIGKPVVLILDTCEELAKLHPAGEPVPGIECTFQILERLHDKVTGMRAVLAGRRLLAAEYANWRHSAGDKPPAWAVSLATRSYLRLFEVRGFTDNDARQFLSTVRKRKRPMPADIEDAILRAAPDSGRVADLMAAGAPDSASRETQQLYNPYELDLYADWFDASDGVLTAAQIESGNLDAYVEGRIIGRLPADPPVARVLPALAALRRIDVHLVRAVLALPEAVGDRGFRTLAEQEWIISRAAEESGVTILEVQPGLLRRLEAYFGRPERVRVRDDVRTMLCDEIPRLLRRRPLDAAAVEHVAGAMRILPDAAALDLWDELTKRIMRDNAWTWAANACARLLANDSDADGPRPALEAAVRAVYIGTLRRSNPAYDVAQEWAFVAAAAARHPDKASGDALADRAAFGIAAARARSDGFVMPLMDDADFRRAWSRTLAAPGNGQRLAAALAAVEAFLDTGADQSSGVLPAVDELQELASASEVLGDSQLTAFARLVLARAELRAGLEVVDPFELAEYLASATSEGWLSIDWPLPRAAQARVRLQWLHATLGTPEYAPAPDRIQRWLDETLGHDEIEYERLASAAMLRLLGRGPVSPDRVRALDQAARTLPSLMPLCQAHIETPPLVASVIRAWTALGDPDAARAMVETLEESSFSVGRDAAATTQVRLATLYLVRRMRWQGLRDSLVLTLATSDSPELALSAQATQVLLGAVSGPLPLPSEVTDGSISEESRQTVDIAWRTAQALKEPDAQVAIANIAKLLDNSTADPILAAHLELDQQEAVRLGERIGWPLSYQADGGRVRETEHAIERRLETGAGSPADAAQLRAIQLRRWALSTDKWTRQDEMPRDWAEAALEEGELLALRLPNEGERLLNLAVQLFDEAGDLMSATLAGISRAIALYHSGDQASARTRLLELKPRYERLRVLSTSQLPAWSELVERSRTHREDDSVGGTWDGWLTRLAACIAPDSVHNSEIAELDLSPVARHSRLPAPLRRLQKRISDQSDEIVGAAGLIVAGAAGGRTALSALGWNPPPIVGWAVGLLVSSVAFFALISAVVVVWLPLGPALMRLIGTQLRLDATVDLIFPDASSLERVYVRLRIQGMHVNLDVFTRYFPGAFRRRFARNFPGWSATSGLPLRPDPLQTSLPPRLARVLRRAGALHADELTLRIGPRAVPGAWETVIGLNQVTAGGKDTDRYFRSFRVYPARKPRFAPAPVPRVAVLCSRPFALFAEESWEAGNVTPELFHTEDLREFEGRTDTGVLHLIGTPVQGELGAVLTLEGSAAQAIQPDRLPLSDPFLIIVQAEPTRSSVSVDPRSNHTRSIAHDIAEASGGASVLVIPALPTHIGLTVVQEIARTVSAKSLDRRALINLVQRLRKIVFEAGAPEAGDTARALPAFDICLYMGE